MSRRDTIIIAALLNAGLLVILFVSALKNPSPSDSISMAPEAVTPQSVEYTAKAEPKAVMGDEVDQMLSQYSQQNPLQQTSAATAEVATAQVPAVQPLPSDTAAMPAPAAQNFVDDLNSLSKSSDVAATAPMPQVEQKAAALTYTEVKVKKGDVLEKIARHHHTSVSEIMKLNRLSSANLKIGQVLKIPSRSAVATQSKTVHAPATSASGEVKYYTVKSGDNPWTIAVKNHMKVEELLKLNNMDAEKAKRLKPGDKIRIR